MTRREIQRRCAVAEELFQVCSNEGVAFFVWEAMLGSRRDIARYLVAWTASDREETRAAWTRIKDWLDGKSDLLLASDAERQEYRGTK